MKKVHLSREQRYTISVMHRKGCSQKMIAATIGKNKSVVCRELKRNANLKGAYSFEYAQGMATLRKERMKKPRTFLPPVKKELVACIQQGWSPQQLVGRRKLKGDPGISHETIYKLIRQDREQGGTLYTHTRHRLKHRKRRKSAFMVMEKLPQGKHAAALANAVVRPLAAYRQQVHTITGDNGTEFADHQAIAKALTAQFFFTHPYSSWEKGAHRKYQQAYSAVHPEKSQLR
jgi:IS30 family transposase